MHGVGSFKNKSVGEVWHEKWKNHGNCNPYSYDRDHSFSMFVTFSEKLAFLTPWYAHARVHIKRLEMLIFWEILQSY